MAYKQTMGKGPAMKTGAGIPKELMSGPAMHEGVVHEGKKPKGTTTRTQEKTTQNGQMGTLTTDTTVTPGYKTSADFTGKPKPSYEEFGAGGGNVAAAKKWNRDHPGSTDVQSRFVADPIKLRTMPVVPVTRIKEDAAGIPTLPKTTTGGGGGGGNGGGGNGGGGGGNGGGGGFGDVVETIGDVVGTVGKFVSKTFKPKRKMGRGQGRTLGTHIGNFFRSCKGGC